MSTLRKARSHSTETNLPTHLNVTTPLVEERYRKSRCSVELMDHLIIALAHNHHVGTSDFVSIVFTKEIIAWDKSSWNVAEMEW